MNRAVTVPARTTEFQRVFVALRYYLGVRGEELGKPLTSLGLGAGGADTIARLAASDRAERARALGSELGLLARALEQRSLTR